MKCKIHNFLLKPAAIAGLLCTYASGQAVVDGTGNTPGAFTSITSAVNSISTGGTVDIIGMIDPGTGNPVGYSQSPFFAGQLAEAFPISVPPGARIRQIGTDAVYIWDSVGGASPPNLFDLQSSTTYQLTRVIGLSFLGGNFAINETVTGSSLQLTTLVRDCRFSGNRVAVVCRSTQGALAEASVRDCLIADLVPPTPSSPPVLQAPQAGLRFWAEDESTGGAPIPSITNGEVLNLNTTGAFAIMDPQYSFGPNDLAVPTTRLVEVFATGSSIAQHPSAPTSYTAVQIPEVNLDIQGGTWTGGDLSSGGGWGSGLHAEVIGADPVGWGPQDYRAGYRITMSGTDISGFGEDGIYLSSFLNGRGNLDMSENCSVTDSGAAAFFNEIRHSGVHGYALEAYLGLTAVNCEFSENLGNGIYLNTDGVFSAQDDEFRLVAPEGVFLGLVKSAVHYNDAHGVYLRNEALQPSGFIGGTIHQALQGGLYQFNIDDDARDFNVPNGQGLINRTSISNNAMAGIRIVAHGDPGLGGEDPDSAPSGVAIRVSNDIVWNNAAGGLSAEWRVRPFGSDFTPKGYYLVPITHSTFVANGADGSTWTLEVDDQNGVPTAARCLYERLDPGTPIFYKTNFVNSILVRDPDTGLGNDLGPVLSFPGNSIVDQNLGIVSATQIGFAGVRGQAFWGMSSFVLQGCRISCCSHSLVLEDMYLAVLALTSSS